MNDKLETNTGLTPEQQLLNDLWEEHVHDEFMTGDTNATLDTMVPNAYVNHQPRSRHCQPLAGRQARHADQG